MSRHNIVIIKDTHRGLLYQNGTLQDVLVAGRYQVPAAASRLASIFGTRKPRVDLILVDMRGRDRTVVVQDFLTAEGATISASFNVQYRVVDARLALHEVKNFDERLYAEVQTVAMRALRGMTLVEVMNSRDEVGEEVFRQVIELASIYGLEVTSLDFKDLVIPEEVRKQMNQAVLASRVRQVEEFDDLDLEIDYHASEYGEVLPMRADLDDSDDLVYAHVNAHANATTGKPTIRPIDFDSDDREMVASGFDPNRRRFRR